MATQEMILKLMFNDDGTFAGLEEINKELEKTDKNTQKVEEATKTLAQQYKALKKEQDQYDPGTAKFAELSAQMGELKDRMNDAADAVRGNTGPAIEGARASFGMLGEQIMNLDFEGLGQSLNLVSGNLARLKPEDLSKGFRAMADAGANALKAIGKAVLANPLLALGAAILAIAMNFDKLVKYFPTIEKGLTGINQQERELLDLQTKKAAEAKNNYDKILLMEASLRAQGKSEKYIRDLKASALQSAILEAKAKLEMAKSQEKSQVDIARRNRDILAGVIKFVIGPLNAILEAIDGAANLLGMESNLSKDLSQWSAGLLFDPEEKKKELESSFQEQENMIISMQNSLDQLKLDQQKSDKDAADKAREDRKKNAEEIKKEIENAKKLYQERRDAEIAAEDAKYKALQALQESAREKEITAAVEASEELYKLAGDDAAAEILIAENLAKQIADINNKYADEEREAREKKNEENAIQAAKELADAKKLEEEKAALRMANIQSNFEMASLALDSLSSLNEAAAKGDEASQRKAFERNKMIQKAQATIAMAAGIVQQLAVPQDQLTGMNFVKAAALAAAGIANIVKINQTQFNGSGTGSGGNGNLNAPTGSTNAPAIDFSGAAMNNNAPGGLETYVLAGNVANALEARQKIIDQSHL